MLKKYSEHFAMCLLIAAVLGLICGFLIGDTLSFIKPLGTLFTRLLLMLVPGLVFFSIASSFANIGDVSRLSKWAGRVIGFFVMTTAIGTFIGIAMGLIFKPGVGLTLPNAEYEVTKISADMFLEWIPNNAFEALAQGNIIQIVFLAIFVGCAVILMKNESRKGKISEFLNCGQELFLTIVKGVMYYAPIGVFALMCTSVADLKGSLLKEMTNFLGAVTLGFVIHIAICYFLIFFLMTKLNPFRFTRKVAPALITALSTCSSAGTLPFTLKCTKDCGVDDELADFGVPLGVTFNMDSMAVEIPLYIMLGMYAVGMTPNIGDLVLFAVMGIAFSVGCAGVPGGGLAIAVILVNAFGLPVEVVGWIAAVFVYLDVTGTAMNIWGDSVCSTIVASRVGLLDREKFNS